jgi:hypothetical protein
MAESSFKRNNRFWVTVLAFGVSVPISIKPKPKLDSSLYKMASLSNQLQVLLDFLNFNPNTSVSNRIIDAIKQLKYRGESWYFRQNPNQKK